MYSYIIKNGFVVDGTGYPGVKQDIAVKDEKIVKIATNIQDEAERTIDVAGKIVAPGFIGPIPIQI